MVVRPSFFLNYNLNTILIENIAAYFNDLNKLQKTIVIYSVSVFDATIEYKNDSSSKGSSKEIV